jgi:hypothetical protein
MSILSDVTGERLSLACSPGICFSVNVLTNEFSFNLKSEKKTSIRLHALSWIYLRFLLNMCLIIIDQYYGVNGVSP